MVWKTCWPRLLQFLTFRSRQHDVRAEDGRVVVVGHGEGIDVNRSATRDVNIVADAPTAVTIAAKGDPPTVVAAGHVVNDRVVGEGHGAPGHAHAAAVTLAGRTQG